MLNMVRILALAFLFLTLGGKSTYAALATDCTLYASPTGNDSNNGTSSSTPKTLIGATNAALSGSVVCIMGGAYNLTARIFLVGGTSSAYTTYKAYGDSTPAITFNGTPGAVDSSEIFNAYGADLFNQGSFTNNYIAVSGITFDGNNKADFCLFWDNVHHIRAIGNTCKNTRRGGIGSIHSDYLTTDGNKITHTGYAASISDCNDMSSSISYNTTEFWDTYTGFHNFVINNIVSGGADVPCHSEGKGFIMDLSANSGTSFPPQGTPPTLVANNVFFENSKPCVTAYYVSDVYTLNNTCYKNDLDSPKIYVAPEFEVSGSQRVYLVNNISYGIDSGHYDYGTSGNPISTAVFKKNIWFNGGGLDFTPPDPAQFIHADPVFVNPPTIASGQYGSALDPASLGNALMLQAGSPAIDQGIDPTTIPGLNTNIIAGLRQYVLSDVNGNLRPQGSGFDIGAYESSSSSAATPLAPNQLRFAP